MGHRIDQLDAKPFHSVLHALTSRKDDNGTIEYSQAAFHFSREIHVPGGIKQVDRVIAPVVFDASTKNRNATFLLLRIIIRIGRPVINSADPMLGSAEVQHPLGNRGLSCINMCNHTDVTNLSNVRGHAISTSDNST